METLPGIPLREIEFDSLVFQDNLEQFLRNCADEPPIWQTADGSIYLTRHEDCHALLLDPQFKRSHETSLTPWSKEKPSASPFARMMKKWMLFLDPPEHTRYRNGIKRGFAPSRIASLESTIVEISQRLVAELPDSGNAELVDDLAYPIPVSVICKLLGAPLEDLPLFKTWSAQLAASINSGDPAKFDEGDAAVVEMMPYFVNLIARKRQQPGDDVISDLVASEEDFSDEEMASTGIHLIWAGHETTKLLISSALLILDRQPEVRAQLRDDPLLITAFVEEALRLESPVQKLSRWTSCDVEIAGHRIPEGRLLTALIGAANRDASVFPNPHKVDLDRRPIQHISFGKGIHHCPGAPLARLEGKIVLDQFLSRFPDYKVESHSWRPYSAFRSLDRLETRLSP